MAGGGGGGEKTEQATPKKKQDERKKGNVFSSKDLVAAIFILIIFGTLKAFAPTDYSVLSRFMARWLDLCGDSTGLLKPANLNSLLIEIMTVILVTAGPLLLVCILVNVLFTGAQTRFIFSAEVLKPKFSRMNPLEGIKKLFSIRSVVELAKSLIKIAVIAALIYSQLKDSMLDLARMMDMEPLAAVVFTASRIFSIVMTIGMAFLAVGILDLAYQWWDHERQMKMTKQEVKEEYKQMEGDPQVKGAIKQKQREMSQKRMMQDVPTADMVVRNPTHVAVAIKYQPEKNSAPVVVAKGADYLAARIVKLAEESGVTTTENIPLARALYENVEVGWEIPPDMYQQVAEVLAWVYELKNSTGKYGGVKPPLSRQITVPTPGGAPQRGGGNIKPMEKKSGAEGKNLPNSDRRSI